MRTITKIACRTIGAAGMGLAVYDAAKVAKQFARNEAQVQEGQHLERAYFNSRNTDSVSFTDNYLREKSFDLRTKNPLYSIWGNIKGGIKGTLTGLGNHLFIVACSMFALLSKGTLAKIGTAGVGLGILYDIARNGFGFAKHHPMESK